MPDISRRILTMIHQNLSLISTIFNNLNAEYTVKIL